MGTPLRALLAEDSEDDALLLARELRRVGYDLSYERVDTPAGMRAALDRQAWDLVLGDYNMPHFSGPAALELVRERDPDVPFIFVSGTIGEDVAVAAMKAGAHDYVMKSNLKRLAPAVERELREADIRRQRRAGQQALVERARLAELSSDVGAALTSGTDLASTLQGCVNALVGHLDAVVAQIWTLDPEAGRLTLGASAGLQLPADPDAAGAGPGRFEVEPIARERRPYITTAVEGDPRIRAQAWARREGVTAFAGYPLVVQDRLGGVLALLARHAFSEFALKTVAWVADGVAVGLERKRAEDALRQSEERFSTAFRASPVGIAITTLSEGRFLDANDAMLTMLGYGRDDLLGRTGAELGIWSDPADETRLRDEIRSGRNVRDLELLLRGKRGDLRCVLTSAEPIALAGERHLLLLLHDITQRKRLEDQFRQAQKMEAVGRLAGGVAHDFNNLLTVILSYGDLLRADLPPNTSWGQDLDEIRKAAEGAASLTRQLLAFSRRQVLQLQVLDLNEVVANTERLLRRLIGEDIDLVAILAPGLARVRADPGQLEQVIMNLGVNARDAMPSGGQLTIETENVVIEPETIGPPRAEPGPYALLAVSDTGVGMDSETQAHIFEPFFTTKEAGKGTGLGLATVSGIVQQSGGFIWVYSELGRGTSFKIYLPAVEAPAARVMPERASTETLRGSETVLLVEDLSAVRAVTREVLERYGYNVLTAADGEAALEVAAEHAGQIDLLLTDVVVSQLSGRDVADRLVAKRPELKVLYMSGYTDDAIVRHGVLQAGIAYLQKPFAPDALVRKVREALAG